MALKILNCKRKTGEYEGRKYDNVVFCAIDENSTNRQLLFGPDVENLKIKADDFSVSFARNAETLDYVNTVQDMQGLFIIPVYDKYGNMADFTLTNGGAAKK